MEYQTVGMCNSFADCLTITLKYHCSMLHPTPLVHTCQVSVSKSHNSLGPAELAPPTKSPAPNCYAQLVRVILHTTVYKRLCVRTYVIAWWMDWWMVQHSDSDSHNELRLLPQLLFSWQLLFSCASWRSLAGSDPTGLLYVLTPCCRVLPTVPLIKIQRHRQQLRTSELVPRLSEVSKRMTSDPKWKNTTV